VKLISLARCSNAVKDRWDKVKEYVIYSSSYLNQRLTIASISLVISVTFHNIWPTGEGTGNCVQIR
jgi:hypothetical protein